MPYIPEQGHKIISPEGALIAKYWEDVPDTFKGSAFQKVSGFWWSSVALAYNPSLPNRLGIIEENKIPEEISSIWGNWPKRTEFSDIMHFYEAKRRYQNIINTINLWSALDKPSMISSATISSIHSSLGKPIEIRWNKNRDISVIFPKNDYAGIDSQGLSVPAIRFFEVSLSTLDNLPWAVHSAFHLKLLRWNILPKERFTVVNPLLYRTVQQYQEIMDNFKPVNLFDIITTALAEGIDFIEMRKQAEEED